MRSLVKIGVSIVVVGFGALACNNTTAITQGIVASNVQPISGQQCSSPEQFIYLPENASQPGPDTNEANNIVITGTADDVLTCSVIPNGANFDLSIIAQITGGSAPGTLHVAGSVAPRQRDANGNPTATGDAVTSPGLTVDFLDPTKHLNEKDCFAQYALVDNGQPNTVIALPGPADTKVNKDGNAGAVWISVFCPKLVNLTSGKAGLDGCMGSATFRIENCTTK